MAIAAAIFFGKYRAERWGETSPEPTAITPAASSGRVSSPTRIYFRHNGLGAHFGALARIDLGGAAPAASFVDQLSCESVYVAGGRGMCLAASRGVVTTYAAKIFNAATYEVITSVPLAGVPSRTRVSADGRLAAATVFVTGHGYDAVDFSTQTLLIDTSNGNVIADLESFRAIENGAPISSADFNFWGVTFTPDGKHFFATLSTGGRHLLVRGDIAERYVEVLHENVECPSLSPDGTRVAYKRRLVENGRISWELYVLDLATGSETPLAERRSVDDQLEWLDDHHVLYSVPSEGNATPTTNVWVTATDGSGKPELFLPSAYSPAVIR
jgi:hypothetical protein